MKDEQLAMISEFQCTGCVNGGPSPKDCRGFQPVGDLLLAAKSRIPFFYCNRHCPGTTIGGRRRHLGLPLGFDIVGWIDGREVNNKRNSNIRLFSEITNPFEKDYTAWSMMYDHLNIPVWARIKDGYLFVRVYLPRINTGWIDVIKLREGWNGEHPLSHRLPLGALNVDEFIVELLKDRILDFAKKYDLD